MKQTFYKCPNCGNIVAYVKRSRMPVFCCEQQMKELIPGAVDAALEKHIPVFTIEEDVVRVKVGSMDHPMLEEHYIEWVSLQTRQGNQRKELSPNDKPEVSFALCKGDEVEKVYAYCNLHGLWKSIS